MSRREGVSGVEVGLINGWGVQTLVIAKADTWLITTEGILAIKDDQDDEVVHFARGRWAYVGHLGLVSVRMGD